MKFWIVVFLLLGSCTGNPAYADEDIQEIKGAAHVLDGDTLRINTLIVRLEGLDAPESGQFCENEKHELWECGAYVHELLADRIRDEEVVCRGQHYKKFGRFVGTCFVNGHDLGQWLVEHGWAVSFTKFTKKYVDVEQRAKDLNIGLWNGIFLHPREWREGKK